MKNIVKHNKALLLILAGLLIGSTALTAAPLFPVTLGTAFPRYENTYLLVGSGILVPIENNMELSLTGAFGIRTDKTETNDVNADFFIPISGGVNFLFPSSETLVFLTGVGLTAQMEFTESSTFHMGPYIKGALRYRVHKNMQLTVEVQQDLVFGPPQWINTTTQVAAGIVCNLN